MDNEGQLRLHRNWIVQWVQSLVCASFAEVLYDHIYKGTVGRHVSKLEPEAEIRRQGALFLIQFWGHISTTDQDIFTKFGV